MISYSRAHGLGNVYLVIDLSQSKVKLSPAVIRRLSHPQLGLGGDGLLEEVPSEHARFGLRIYNPDGSEAEKSGNGLRIFARTLYDRGQLPPGTRIETRGGLVEASPIERPGQPPLFVVEMGHADFDPARTGFHTQQTPLVEASLEVLEQMLTVTAVSMGNPHLVLFGSDALDSAPVEKLGPALEWHPWFPGRTNVQFARCVSRHQVEARIWERGAGETLASGSSACAVAAAGVKTGRLDSPVEVIMPGGVLQVEISEDFAIRQTGPVTVVEYGRLSEEFEQELLGL